jgi:hypothetical protein
VLVAETYAGDGLAAEELGEVRSASIAALKVSLQLPYLVHA